MQFLPIVERELRVSARKQSTFWLRLIAALIGLFIGIGCVSIQAMTGGGTAAFGQALFQVLSWISLAAALSAGIFFTSDAISEEKREGTLGLLFLTDLRGYDVVSGKLLVTSLRGCYALLAIVPILAITLLMGGVQACHFAKASLALLNALFCSLTAGLMVSCFCRDPQRTLAATVVLLLLLIFGGFLADKIWANAHKQVFASFMSVSSPAYTFAVSGSDWRAPTFWLSLGITHAIGWFFLMVACFFVPRTWQDAGKAQSLKSQGALRFWRFGSARRHARLRARLLDRDVVMWLFCRERWRSLGLWAMVLLALAGVTSLFIKAERQVWMAWQYLSWFFLMFFYLWAASNACRFFVDARRSGLIELILATPVTDRDVVRGHWRGVFRQFGLPLCIIVGIVAAASWLGQSGWQKTLGRIPPTPPVTATAGTNVVVSNTVVMSVSVNGRTVSNYNSGSSTNSPAMSAGRSAMIYAIPIAGALIGGGTTAANFLAIICFGMWMGMTSRSVNTATAKTILFVHVIPWLCIAFISAIAVAAVMMGFTVWRKSTWPAQYVVLYPLLSLAFTGVLTLAKDIGFFLWASAKLRRSFRDQAVRGMGEQKMTFAPALPPLPIAPPPILAS